MRVLIVSLLLLAGCSGTDAEQAAEHVASTCQGIANSEMVWVEGGDFTIGKDPLYPEEGPPRMAEVTGFWIGQTEVTNAQFARFIEETGYMTAAQLPPPVLEGASPEMLVPGSAVFRVPTDQNRNWWAWVPGATWQNPSGPGSAIDQSGNDPVVQIAYQDAEAYAQWAEASLPSEEQWEYAARAGGDALAQPKDAEPKDSSGVLQANYYQGVFPAKDLGEDGFTSRAPAGCFAANGYGLYDMIGNVWEWTTTDAGRSDAVEPVKVIKGGSFLCAANYCARYRPAARQFQERGLGTDHIGFRLVDNERAAPADWP